MEDSSKKLQNRIDRAYTERNYAVIAAVKLALLAGLNAGQGIDDQKDWDMEWRHVLYIDYPNGKQVSWHIHPKELEYIKDIPKYEGTWNGSFISRSPECTKITKEPINGRLHSYLFSERS